MYHVYIFIQLLHVGDLAEAIRNNTEMKFGLYYSLMEWFNPMYLADKNSNWTQQTFVDNKMLPEMYEVVSQWYFNS